MSRDTKDLLDLMTSIVLVEKLVSRDANLAATYKKPKRYRARVVYQTHIVRAPNGENVTANGIIWLAAECEIPTTARITLPDKSQPPILKSAAPTDETSEIMYVRLDFG